MGEFVDLLFHCYTRNDIVDEFPATLERLRSNINDPRWQRKIVYFQAICALWPDWNIASGLRELKKLGSLRDESDVETLQLYVCLSGTRLSFSEKQYYVDKIIQLADSAVDRLHYRGFKAVELLLIGEKRDAEREAEEAIAEFRVARDGKKLTPYETDRLANLLDLLGSIRDDKSLLAEAAQLLQEALREDVWTTVGRAQLYNQLGEVFKHMGDWEKAQVAFKSAVDTESSPVSAVLLSECLLHLDRANEAKQLLAIVHANHLSESEYADYVFISAAIAIKTGDRTLLETADEELRTLEVRQPFFREQRDSLRLDVVETLRTGTSESLVHRARQTLARLSRHALKYLLLQPNFFGIGVNVERVIEDLAMGTEQHIAKEKEATIRTQRRSASEQR